MSTEPTANNSSPKFLEDWELSAIDFIETHHSVTGRIPSDSAIIEASPADITSQHLARLKRNNLFQASMSSRGLVLNYDPAKQFRDVFALTAKQIAAASLLTNVADRRSDEKKLRDLGVSTEEWTNWIQDLQFSEYLRERSELLIANSQHSAHLGLLRGVNQGNTASIKLYYELTGRYNPNEEGAVNIRMVIGRVLEAIQKHIRDPATLNALAVEMSQIAIEAGSPPPVAKSPFIPESTTRKIEG